MKFFVTGSSGYIGRELVKLATEEGHTLVCAGREWTNPAQMALIRWNTFDGVIHLASAGVRRIAKDRTWADCIAVNFSATSDLLFAIKKSGATMPVFICGSIREKETVERPDYWSDPYIVSQKLRRLFVDEWAQSYGGTLLHPFIQRCGTPDEVAALCREILNSI